MVRYSKLLMRRTVTVAFSSRLWLVTKSSPISEVEKLEGKEGCVYFYFFKKNKKKNTKTQRTTRLPLVTALPPPSQFCKLDFLKILLKILKKLLELKEENFDFILILF